MYHQYPLILTSLNEEVLKTLKRNDAKLISTHDNRNLEEI